MTLISFYQQHLKLLKVVAYRMLGSVQEAEDITQELYFKIRKVDSSKVRQPKNYLVSSVTRLCIDRLNKLKLEREQYQGPWLPEPFVTNEIDQEQVEKLSFGYMLLLERLSPLERAVYVLRNAYDYSYKEIARLIDKTEANCRKIYQRSNEKIDAEKLGNNKKEITIDILQKLITLSQEGRQEKFIEVLSEGTVLIADGGGIVPGAPLSIVAGFEKISSFMINASKNRQPKNAKFEFIEINGQPMLVGFVDNEAFILFSIEHNNKRAEQIFLMVNPNKLKFIPKPVTK